MSRLARTAALLLPLALAACSESLVCPVGTSECGGACVTLGTDPDHCGACGTRCGDREVGAAGSCACAPGLAGCGGACVDLASDPGACGSCGTACPGSQVCSTADGVTACFRTMV